MKVHLNWISGSNSQGVGIANCETEVFGEPLMFLALSSNNENILEGSDYNLDINFTNIMDNGMELKVYDNLASYNENSNGIPVGTIIPTGLGDDTCMVEMSCIIERILNTKGNIVNLLCLINGVSQKVSIEFANLKQLGTYDLKAGKVLIIGCIASIVSKDNWQPIE